MPLSFSKRPSLVAYVTCGDPDLATTLEVILSAARAGADIVELGVPFSDPVADGPVIQRASERALRAGTTLVQVLEIAAEVRRQSTVGLIIFSYLNPILRFGLERFCVKASAAGVDGALIIDLPAEESVEYLRLMRQHNLATVFLAAPTSTGERLRAIAAASTGFVYAVSRTGVTGTREQLPPDARELVERIRRFTSLPIAVGFGISTTAQVEEVGRFAEAAVVGSAIVHTIEQAAPEGRAPQAVAELISRLAANSAPPSASTASKEAHG
jgi:tryptophan synthase alpha chain